MKSLAERIKENERHRAYYAIPENDARRRAALALKKQDPKWQARALESARRFRNSFTEEEWREYVRYAAEKYYDKRRKKKK
jgi:hypothetical protein